MIRKMADYTNNKYGKGVLSLSKYMLDVWVPEVSIYYEVMINKLEVTVSGKGVHRRKGDMGYVGKFASF